MYEFEYVKAATVEEALAVLKEDEEASPIAGGQTLIPTLKQRLAMPSKLVDISKIEALRGVRREGNTLRIGAMTRHAEVASSDAVKDVIPGLAYLAGLIGDPHVRHRGTMGGSIANNDPAADYPAACLGLGATIVTSARELVADDFFTGLFDTALEEGEIVTEVIFPIPEAMGYEKFPNPASRYALVGVCVAKTATGARVSVTGSGADGVFRWTEAEDALSSFEAGALDGLKISPDLLSSDMHAQADYRASLIVTMAQRALAKALA